MTLATSLSIDVTPINVTFDRVTFLSDANKDSEKMCDADDDDDDDGDESFKMRKEFLIVI